MASQGLQHCPQVEEQWMCYLIIPFRKLKFRNFPTKNAKNRIKNALA